MNLATMIRHNRNEISALQETPRVLDVGNCRPDHFALRRLLTSMGAEVDQTHHLEDTLEALRSKSYRLVLINRKLDQDYSDGIDIVRAIRGHREFDSIGVMLISNYPQAHSEAMEAGAIRGFGKLELDLPRTRDTILRALTKSPA